MKVVRKAHAATNKQPSVFFYMVAKQRIDCRLVSTIEFIAKVCFLFEA